MDAAASLPQARRIQQLQSQVYHDQTFLVTTVHTARYAGSPDGFQHSHHFSSHDSVDLEHYGFSNLDDGTPSSETSYEIDVDDWTRPFECGPKGAGSKGKGKSHGEYIGDVDIYDFGGTYTDRDHRKMQPKKGNTDGAGHNDATGTPSDDQEPLVEDSGTGAISTMVIIENKKK